MLKFKRLQHEGEKITITKKAIANNSAKKWKIALKRKDKRKLIFK